jgi:hypothetical protein
MGRGPCRRISFLIVEGDANVRIGIRGSIVHIDRRNARIAAIVSVSTTEHSTEARTSPRQQATLLEERRKGSQKP